MVVKITRLLIQTCTEQYQGNKLAATTQRKQVAATALLFAYFGLDHLSLKYNQNGLMLPLISKGCGSEKDLLIQSHTTKHSTTNVD